MRGSPLERLRRICLALPGAIEKEAWQTATFRAPGGKMYAMFVENHHGDERVAVWCKAPKEVQEILVGAAPKRFFVPPYVGPKGWIGIRLDVDVDWPEVAALIKDGYEMSLSKRAASPRPRHSRGDARRSVRGAVAKAPKLASRSSR